MMPTVPLPPQGIKDAADVSTVLFRKKIDPPLSVEPFVGPIQVTCDANRVAHGRGVVATRSIAAGELLMMTPPTVHASVAKVHQCWSAQRKDGPDNVVSLESCAEQTLVDAMAEACRNNNSIAASFAVLVGVNHKDVETRAPPLDVLLGKGSSSIEVDCSTMTRDILLRIVRANAFGPDGVQSYTHVEERWTSAETTSSVADETSHPELLQHTPRLLDIYPLAAMLNHSCNANAVRVYAGNVMVVHALHDIPEGTEVVWSYVPPSQPHRRPTLERLHGFVCRCDRCVAENVVLQAWEAQNPSNWQRWNHGRLTDFPSYLELHTAVAQGIETRLVEATTLSNQLRRYIRIGYLHLYIHYFNVALANILTEDDPVIANVLRTELLRLTTQLHFSFCATHNASTEHLSVLHLCYELAGQLHARSTNTSETLAKVRFWTEQLKRVHMIRYGRLGQDINNVRRAMQHSRTILRQPNGWDLAVYNFL